MNTTVSGIVVNVPPVLRYGDNSEEVRMLQKALNPILGLRLTTDGGFGKLTEEALRAYQRSQNLPVTGVYEGETSLRLNEYISRKFLRTGDIAEAAKLINVPASILMAFREVEASGDGFLPDGRVVILFERHKMYAQLLRSFGKAHADAISKIAPDVVNLERGGYKGKELEWDRLNKAQGYSRDGGLNSCSWGLFQIMGYNSKICGYPNIEDFVVANQRSEKDQLMCVLNFIKNQPDLLMAIRQRNYLRIAQIYNGIAQNGYDVKLGNADRKYKQMGY